MEKVMRFLRDEEGASAVEYGLLVGVIAVAIITVAAALGDELEETFRTVKNKLRDDVN